jgi:hypothetical protein
VAITGLIDEELIAVLPKSLKFIAHNGMSMRFWEAWKGDLELKADDGSE